MAIERTSLNRLKGYVRVALSLLLSPYLYILSAEPLANKVRQDSIVKGIKIFGKVSQALSVWDDTTQFNADFRSKQISKYFMVSFPGENTWDPIFLWCSDDKTGNNELNFSQKIRNSKPNWICGAQETWQYSEEYWYLVLSQLVYSASNLVVPQGTAAFS